MTEVPLPQVADCVWTVTCRRDTLWNADTEIAVPGGGRTVFHGLGHCADVAIHEAHRAMVRYWRAAERAAEIEARV